MTPDLLAGVILHIPLISLTHDLSLSTSIVPSARVPGMRRAFRRSLKACVATDEAAPSKPVGYHSVGSSPSSLRLYESPMACMNIAGDFGQLVLQMRYSVLIVVQRT